VVGWLRARRAPARSEERAHNNDDNESEERTMVVGSSCLLLTTTTTTKEREDNERKRRRDCKTNKQTKELGEDPTAETQVPGASSRLGCGVV